MPNTNPDPIERYAELLIKMGEAADALPRLEQELRELVDAYGQSEDLRRFLASPTIREEGKRSVFEEWLGTTVHPALRHFAFLLVDMHLVTRLPAIADAFFDSVAWLRRQETGELVSARPVSEACVAQIAREAGRILGRDVHLHARVDPGLLGGIKVSVGDFVLDGTVEHHLASLHRELLS